MSLPAKGEFRPVSELSQVIPWQKFIPKYWEVPYSDSPSDVIAEYPLGLIRRALNEFMGSNVELSRASAAMPELILNTGKVKDIHGVLPAPTTFYIENDTVKPKKKRPDASLNMDIFGETCDYAGVPTFSLKFAENDPVEQRIILPELESIGKAEKSKSLIKAQLTTPLPFKITSRIKFSSRNVENQELTPEVMAKKGLVGLERLILSFQRAIKTGIVYTPEFCNPRYANGPLAVPRWRL